MERGASHPKKALQVPVKGQHSYTMILKNQRLKTVAQGAPVQKYGIETVPHGSTINSGHSDAIRSIYNTLQRQNIPKPERKTWLNLKERTCLDGSIENGGRSGQASPMRSQSREVGLAWDSSSCGDNGDT